MNEIASLEDATEITNLISLLRDESRYKAFPLNRLKLLGFVKTLIEDENSLVLINRDKDEIIGLFIANIDEMYFSDSTVASDFIFYVSPGSRNKGIGASMIDSYISWAKEMKADDISLSTSTGLSSKAIEKIAEKYGMESTGLLYGMVNHV